MKIYKTYTTVDGEKEATYFHGDFTISPSMCKVTGPIRPEALPYLTEVTIKEYLEFLEKQCGIYLFNMESYRGALADLHNELIDE